MADKKWIVNLNADEREQLRKLIRQGKAGGRTLNRAQVLLLADEGWTAGQLDSCPAGQRTRLSRRCTPAFRRWSAPGGGVWKVGWSMPCVRKRVRNAGRSWMAKDERFWWRRHAASHQKDAPHGRCSCWQIGWLSSRSLNASATKRFAPS